MKPSEIFTPNNLNQKAWIRKADEKGITIKCGFYSNEFTLIDGKHELHFFGTIAFYHYVSEKYFTLDENTAIRFEWNYTMAEWDYLTYLVN